MIAVLATDGFEQVELTDPVAALKAAGATVHIVAPKSGAIQGFKHRDEGDTTAVDKALGEGWLCGLIHPRSSATVARQKSGAAWPRLSK